MKNAKLGMRLNDKGLRANVKDQVRMLRNIDPEGHTLLPGSKIWVSPEEASDALVIITNVSIHESGLVFQGMTSENKILTFGADEIECGPASSTLRSRYVKRVMAVQYPHLTASHDPREAARRENPIEEPSDDPTEPTAKYPVEMPLPVQGLMCYDNNGAAYVLHITQHGRVVHTCLEGAQLSMQHGTSDEETFYRLQEAVRTLPQSFWHKALADYEHASEKTHLVKSTVASFALSMMRTTNPLTF